MTKPGVWKAYGLRMASVWLAVLSAGAAQAGAWEEFEARCLTPLEAVQTPIVAGLRSEEPRDGFLYWSGHEDWLLAVQAHLEVPVSCLIHGFDWAEAGPAAFDWARAAVAAGRYEPLPKVSMQAAQVFRSLEIREPRLDVIFQRFHPELGAYLLVRETDLES